MSLYPTDFESGGVLPPVDRVRPARPANDRPDGRRFPSPDPEPEPPLEEAVAEQSLEDLLGAGGWTPRPDEEGEDLAPPPPAPSHYRMATDADGEEPGQLDTYR